MNSPMGELWVSPEAMPADGMQTMLGRGVGAAGGLAFGADSGGGLDGGGGLETTGRPT